MLLMTLTLATTAFVHRATLRVTPPLLEQLRRISTGRGGSSSSASSSGRSSGRSGTQDLKQTAPMNFNVNGRSSARHAGPTMGADRVDEFALTFLGTSSSAPSTDRNQQSLVMQFCGETWMFDCGEAAQHRIMSTTLSAPSIKRIFISHMHGDHWYGLPGMLCNMAAAYGGGEDGDIGKGKRPSLSGLRPHLPVEIVGPPGLRSAIRAVIGNSYATLGDMNIMIHELAGMRAIVAGPVKNTPPVTVARPLPNELPGLDLEPSADGVWSIPIRDHEPPVEMVAVELDHTVPTVGWVLTERPRPGRLDGARAKKALQAHGLPLKDLKILKAGQPLPLPDGTALEPADYVGPSTQRRLAILSDMRDAKVNKTLLPLLQDATLLIHECTNAHLASDPSDAGKSPLQTERRARRHGHSTPQMAGRLAAKVNAQHLVLTHFSPRYGSRHNHSVTMMSEIRSLAARQMAPGPKQSVTTAVDLMRLEVSITGQLEVQMPDEGLLASGGGRFVPQGAAAELSP